MGRSASCLGAFGFSRSAQLSSQIRQPTLGLGVRHTTQAGKQDRSIKVAFDRLEVSNESWQSSKPI